MDLYNTCNVCYEGINEGEDVIVTEDAVCMENTGKEMSMYEVDPCEPYRGVYCRDCWGEMLSHQYRLNKKHEESRI